MEISVNYRPVRVQVKINFGLQKTHTIALRFPRESAGFQRDSVEIQVTWDSTGFQRESAGIQAGFGAKRQVSAFRHLNYVWDLRLGFA